MVNGSIVLSDVRMHFSLDASLHSRLRLYRKYIIPELSSSGLTFYQEFLCSIVFPAKEWLRNQQFTVTGRMACSMEGVLILLTGWIFLLMHPCIEGRGWNLRLDLELLIYQSIMSFIRSLGLTSYQHIMLSILYPTIEWLRNKQVTRATSNLGFSGDYFNSAGFDTPPECQYISCQRDYLVCQCAK